MINFDLLTDREERRLGVYVNNALARRLREQRAEIDKGEENE